MPTLNLEEQPVLDQEHENLLDIEPKKKVSNDCLLCLLDLDNYETEEIH